MSETHKGPQLQNNRFLEIFRKPGVAVRAEQLWSQLDLLTSTNQPVPLTLLQGMALVHRTSTVRGTRTRKMAEHASKARNKQDMALTQVQDASIHFYSINTVLDRVSDILEHSSGIPDEVVASTVLTHATQLAAEIKKLPADNLYRQENQLALGLMRRYQRSLAALHLYNYMLHHTGLDEFEIGEAAKEQAKFMLANNTTLPPDIERVEREFGESFFTTISDAHRKQLESIIRNTFQSQSQEYIEAFILTYIRGLSPEEASIQTGVNTTAIRQHNSLMGTRFDRLISTDRIGDLDLIRAMRTYPGRQQERSPFPAEGSPVFNLYAVTLSHQVQGIQSAMDHRTTSIDPDRLFNEARTYLYTLPNKRVPITQLQYAVLALRFENKTIDEIAESFQRSPSEVAQTLAEARQLFLQYISQTVIHLEPYLNHLSILLEGPENNDASH